MTTQCIPEYVPLLNWIPVIMPWKLHIISLFFQYPWIKHDFQTALPHRATMVAIFLTPMYPCMLVTTWFFFFFSKPICGTEPWTNSESVGGGGDALCDGWSIGEFLWTTWYIIFFGCAMFDVLFRPGNHPINGAKLTTTQQNDRN